MCGGLESICFGQFVLLEHAAVLYGLICNNFTLRGCGGLVRTDFGHFAFWEGKVSKKGLTWDHFLC